MNHELPLFTKTSRLYEEIYKQCRKMPKLDRYNLGVKIENNCLTALECLISAENLSGRRKLNSLESANIKFEILKVLIRFANKQKIITNNDYLKNQEALQEIGRMIGGWIKYVKNKEVIPSTQSK